VDQAGSDLDAAIKANARIQASLLRTGSTVISSRLKEKKLMVIAAYYDLATGSVTRLE
jgi:carbonic anhydrase